MTAFVEKLTAHLQRNGLSESEFAREIGTASSQVNRWTKGETRPTGRNLVKCLDLIPGLVLADVYPTAEPASESPTPTEEPSAA